MDVLKNGKIALTVDDGQVLSAVTGRAVKKIEYGDDGAFILNAVTGRREYFIPGSSGGGGGTFYKCASVNATDKTWTGYKALLVDGVYAFEEVATPGLTYGVAYTPAAGSIYNADATISVAGMWQGRDPSLLFYAPLTAAAATAETGQTLTASGNVQYTSRSGKMCAYFNGGNDKLTAQVDGFPVSGKPLSMAGWFLFTAPYDSLDKLLAYGDYQAIMEYDGALRWQYGSDFSGDSFQQNYAVEDENWHHVAVTADGKTLCIYIDGALKTSKDGSIESDGASQLIIGAGSGAVSDVYVYNRCLSADEISELYSK